MAAIERRGMISYSASAIKTRPPDGIKPLNWTLLTTVPTTTLEQASLAGLRARSTSSRHNPASLKSHRAVAAYRVVAELPNDYLMIEFPPVWREKPELMLPHRASQGR